MANVTIYEKGMNDGRIKLLGKLLGTSRFDARGRMIEIWNQCTEENTYALSPAIIDCLAEHEGFSALLIQAELGEVQDDGRIRVRGTEGRVEWLAESRGVASEGGKARARSAKRNEKGHFIPDGDEPPAPKIQPAREQLDPARSSQLDPAGSSGIQPSIPIHSNSIHSKTKNYEEPSGGAASQPTADRANPVVAQTQLRLISEPARATSPPSPVHEFISAYVRAYRERYPGARPELGPKQAGLARNLVKGLGVRRACDLIQVYCQHDDPWFVKKSHDLVTFSENLNIVSKALDTGQKDDPSFWDYVFGRKAGVAQ